MFGVGGWELFVIFLIVLLFFGAKRLPEIAKAMGHSVNEFRKAKDEITNYSAEKPSPEADKKQDPKQVPGGGEDAKTDKT